MDRCQTEKGYVRYRFNRDGRVMEHVAVARIAWGPRVPWPQGCDVHHMDGKRCHNCRANLLILPKALHYASNGTTRQRRYETTSHDPLDSCTDSPSVEASSPVAE